MQLSDQCTA